jgi:GMP synthase-like glutamine amidotransferase
LRVLVVQNNKTESLGLYKDYLERRGIKHQIFHAYRARFQTPFPSVEEFDAFIIGPTPISAKKVEEHYFLMREWELFKDIVESGKPCLGICCGGQMLARYLGANVRKSPEREIGVYYVRLTELGETDPLFDEFPKKFPVFHWHSEVFEVPSGGELLVEGYPCFIQAFRWKKVRGIIFHLEITATEAVRWAEAYPEDIETMGKTRNQIVTECREKEPTMRLLAELLMKNFLGMT